MKRKSRVGKKIGKSVAYRACMAVLASVLASLAAMPIAAQAQAVLQVPSSNRYAGSTAIGWNQDSGTASTTELNNPTYSVFDTAGNLYISDTNNNCVRKVDATTGSTSVVAGYEATPGSPDTCNTSAVVVSGITPTQGVVSPEGLAINSGGDLFIVDNGHNCVRKLPAASLAAGGGSSNLVAVVDTCLNYGSQSNTNASAVPGPQGIVLDSEGDENVSIYDPADGISQVVYHREYAPADPATLVCDEAGLPVAGHQNSCPFDSYGGQTYVLNDPTGLAIDGEGDFYLSDTGNSCVRELTAVDTVKTPVGVCTSDGSGTTPVANFSPTGIAIGSQGYIYVSNASQGTVLQVTGAGATPTIFAGIPNTQSTTYTGQLEGAPAVDISMNNPTGISVDPSGNIYVADSGNGIIRQLTLDTQFGSEYLKNPSAPLTLQFEINAAVNLTTTPGTDFDIYNGDNTCTGALTPSATATPTTCSITLYFDPSYPGERRSPLTLTDSISSTSFTAGLSGIGLGANALFIPGRIQTILPSLNAPSATVVDTAGDIYYAETGTGDIKFVPAGTTTATTLVPSGGQIQSPVGLALDAAQNLYVADNVANAIFKVNANGVVSTVTTAVNDPVALVVDNEGNLYVAEDGAGSVGVWKIFAGGEQLQIAGQGTNTAANGVAATQAKFAQPSGLYLDPSGVLYVSDQAQYRVYDIDTGGIIHFFAGNGTQSTSQSGTPTGTGLLGPSGLIGDAAGDIYIADGPANLVYVVFAGSNQNAGIETLAGSGTVGNTGDNGPANVADLNNPISLALDSADDLYLVDAGNNSIREVDYQDPSLIFGDEKPGVTSAPLSTQLWDSGNQELQPLSNFEPQDNVDFALTADGCGNSLIVGATCTLTYTFTPATYGDYETQATSLDNAVDDRQVVTLVGNSPQPVFSTPPVTAVYGSAYTLTASFTSATGFAPTGTMTFAIGAQNLCTVALVPPNGTVTCSPSPTLLNAAAYSVTVSYSGDSNYLAATSTLPLTITPIPVTITANDASRPYDMANPTFSGTVVAADPIPTGQTVTESTYTTTAVLLSPPGQYPITPGTATLGGGALPVNYSITYVNGTLTIGTFTTPVAFNSPAVTAVYGQTTPYTLSTTITSGQSPAPTGTVTFAIASGPGAQTLCASVPLSAGTATCSPSTTLLNVLYSNMQVTNYTVTLTYSGDQYYAAATSTMSLTITPATLTITCNYTRPFGTPNPSPFIGTYTGLVAGQSFTDTFTTLAGTSSPPGTYIIFVGNPATPGPGTLASNYTIIYIDGTLTITPTSTGLTVSSPPVTAVYGQQPPYTLTATVTSTLMPAPTGTVTFAIPSGTGAQTLCANVPLTSGTATCSPSPTLLDVLYAGGNVTPYAVTVSYSGDTNYQPANSNLALTITPVPVTITANPATRAYGQPNPTFTGTITTPDTIPTGQSVTATYATTATLTTPPGVYTGANGIVPTAVFGTGTVPGDYAITNVDGALTITQESTGPTIKAQPVTAVYSTAYTLAASVTSTTTPAPTGTVTFSIGSQTLCAKAPLTAGNATCSPSPTLLNVLYAGASVTAYNVTVSYSGDTIYPANATTLALTITPDPVTITAANASRVIDTPNPTFTGTVKPQDPFPTGQTITATFSTPATQTGSGVGNYPIIPAAVAGANTLLANYAITLVNGVLTITPPSQTSPTGDFTLSATPPEQEIDREGTVNFPVTLTSQKNFTDHVTFSCSGLPEGITCSFAPGTVAPAANATASTVMTLTGSVDDTNVPPGSFGYMKAMPPAPGNSPAPLILAWTMLPIGFSGSAASLLAGFKRRNRRSNKKTRFTLWLVPLLLILAGLSGCGAPNNFKIYTVTITATDSTYATPLSNSTTVQLVLAR